MFQLMFYDLLFEMSYNIYVFLHLIYNGIRDIIYVVEYESKLLAVKSFHENVVCLLIDLINRELTQQKLSVRSAGQGESLGNRRDLVEQDTVHCVGLR